MKEIFTTKEQGRMLVEAGLPISTAIGFRDKYLDSLHSMEDDAGRIGLIEAVTPDISNPVWDVGTLLNLLPYEKLGKPNYKNKHDNQSFRLPFPKFKITNNKIRIEKIGWVKIVIDRGVPDNARFISCTVSKNRAGQYFVSVLVETEQCYKQKTSKTVGVDLGIKTLATLSDGIAVENPHFLCENQAKS